MRGRPCGNKKIQGRKRFIVTDVLGLLLALSITEANVGERAGALVVLAKLGNRFSRLKTILADQGFDGVEFIANVKTQFSLIMEVVCQGLGRSRVRVKGFTVLPKPHRFLWIKQGLAHNFCHIFYLGEQWHKLGESAARAAPQKSAQQSIRSAGAV